MSAREPTSPATVVTGEPASQDTLVDDTARDGEAVGPLTRGTAIDRYVVLDRVGAGGMGVIYAAFDPDLDRKVAIKVLHRVGDGVGDGSAARTRMLREAQALAKLTHPNVVAIHDVGTYGERAWIAMEFVVGQTLGAWLGASPRPWPQVLDVMTAAGRGVAAAHAAGLLHRDLKPDNVMVGDDGRVRVMDFGLARGHDVTLVEPSGVTTSGVTAGTALALDVTRAGALIGTPAYMAPEQLGGAVASPASDQFSFCVTLWEALYGVRPFTGHNVHEIVAAMLDGEPRRGDVRVPAWLRRVVQRGLAADESGRYPSMDALLAAMGDGRRRGARRNLALFAFGGAAVIAGVITAQQVAQRQRVAGCEREATAIAAQWPGRSDEVLDAIVDHHASFAAATVTRLPPWLDDFAGRWSQAHARMCLAAEVEHTLTPALHERAQHCLDAHRMSLTALLDALAAGEPTAVRGAVTAAAGLADPSECTDVVGLERTPWPDEIAGDRVAQLRARLAEADGFDAAGAHAKALAIDDEVLAEAVALDWMPLVAEAQLHRGRRLAELTRLPEAEASLRAAYFGALRSGADRIAARAATVLVRTIGNRMGRFDEGLAWGEHAASVLDRAMVTGELERATLDTQLARVRRERGDLAQSRELELRALEVRERLLGEDHPDVADSLDSLGNTLNLIGDRAAAEAAHRRGLAIRERVFGPDHPIVAASLNNLANSASDAARHQEAVALYERAIAIGEGAYGPDHLDLAAGFANLGSLYMDMGRPEEARRLHARALAIEEHALGPEHHEVAASLANLGGDMLELGDFAGAAANFERALAIAERRLGATHPQIGMTLFNIGLVRTAMGDYAAAEAAYRRTIDIFDHLEHDRDGLLATARMRLGGVLRKQGRLDDADAQLRRALQAQEAAHHPDLPETLYELGELELARGRVDEAIASFERASSIDGPDAVGVAAARVRFALALARIASGEPEPEHRRVAQLAIDELRAHRAAPVELDEARRRLAGPEGGNGVRRPQAGTRGGAAAATTPAE